MNNKKQFILNFISQIIFFVVNFGVSFFLVPYIVESINATAYGFVGLSNDFVSYAQLLTVALNSLVGRYIVISLFKKDYKKANSYFNSAFFVNLLFSIILFVLSLFFIIFIDKIINVPKELITDVRLLFTFTFITFFINIISSVFSVGVFATNKLYKSSIISVISQIVRVIILFITFFVLDPSVWYIGFAGFIGTSIISVGNLIFTFKLIPELKINFKYFNIKRVFEVMKMGIWNTISRLSSIISNGLDLLITNLMVSSAAMGILSLPRSVHTIILNLFGSIAGIFSPRITYGFANNDTEDIKRQLIFSYKFLGVFSNACLIAFIIGGMDFFRLWVPSQDTNLIYLIAILSCSSLVFGLPMESFYNLFTAANKIKTPAIVSMIFSFITIIIVFISLSLTNDDNVKLIIISSTSSFTGLIRILTLLPLYSSSILKVKKTYFYPVILKNLLAFIISLIITYFIGKVYIVSGWISLIILCLIIFALTFVITYFINFNNEEKKEFYKYIFRRKNESSSSNLDKVQ